MNVPLLDGIVMSLFSCCLPPRGASTKNGGLEPGHQSRQCTVSIWHRSKDNTTFRNYSTCTVTPRLCNAPLQIGTGSPCTMNKL